MSICTLAEAKRNLKSLKRNHGEIDEQNPEQVQCYIMLRRTTTKVFAEKFLEAWKKRRLDVTAGLRFKRGVWLVPRVNFPLGLPPAVNDAQLSPEQRVAMEQQTGYKIDDACCFLIDTCIDRGALGKNVEEAEYYVDAGTKLKDVGPGPRALDDAPSGSGSGLLAAAAKPADSGDKPADSGVKLADSGVKLADSGAMLADSGGVILAADSGVKLADSGGVMLADSGVKSASSGGPLGDSGEPVAVDLLPPTAAGSSAEVSSTPPEKKLGQTLKEAFFVIKQKLTEAFTNGHYWSDDVFDYFHGWAWANNIVTTIEGMPGREDSGGVRTRGRGVRTADAFSLFLADLLCRYPCYRVLHKFIPLFDRLEGVKGLPAAATGLPAAAAAAATGLPAAAAATGLPGDAHAKIKLLRKIAMTVDPKTKHASLPEAALSLAGLSLELADTTDFLSCTIFSDYVTAVTESRLEGAKKEKDPAKCHQTLATLSKLPSLPKHWQSKIAIGLSVFDTATTKATRVKYILQNDSAASLVYDWWPNGVFAVCSRIVNSEVANCEWDVFREALELLIEAGEQEQVDRAEFALLLAAVAATVSGGTLPLWASAILRETCGLVFGVLEWQRGDKRFEGIDFDTFTAKDKESFTAFLRDVQKLLGTEIKMNGKPGWLNELTALKDQWKKEKAANPSKRHKSEGDGKLGTAAANAASGAGTAQLAGAAAATEAAVGPVAASGAPPQASLLAGAAAATEAAVGPALAASGALSQTAPPQASLPAKAAAAAVPQDAPVHLVAVDSNGTHRPQAFRIRRNQPLRRLATCYAMYRGLDAKAGPTLRMTAAKHADGPLDPESTAAAYGFLDGAYVTFTLPSAPAPVAAPGAPAGGAASAVAKSLGPEGAAAAEKTAQEEELRRAAQAEADDAEKKAQAVKKAQEEELRRAAQAKADDAEKKATEASVGPALAASGAQTAPPVPQAAAVEAETTKTAPPVPQEVAPAAQEEAPPDAVVSAAPVAGTAAAKEAVAVGPALAASGAQTAPPVPQEVAPAAQEEAAPVDAPFESLAMVPFDNEDSDTSCSWVRALDRALATGTSEAASETEALDGEVQVASPWIEAGAVDGGGQLASGGHAEAVGADGGAAVDVDDSDGDPQLASGGHAEAVDTPVDVVDSDCDQPAAAEPGAPAPDVAAQLAAPVAIAAPVAQPTSVEAAATQVTLPVATPAAALAGPTATALALATAALAAAASQGDLAPGTLVTTKATKKKEAYDNQKAKIISALASTYKVELLTGPEKGTTKKYGKKLVFRVAAPEQLAGGGQHADGSQPAGGGQPAGGSQPAGGGQLAGGGQPAGGVALAGGGDALASGGGASSGGGAVSSGGGDASRNAAAAADDDDASAVFT